MSNRIVAIPDLHFPWVNTRALSRVLEFIQGFKPHILIQLGDLYDMYSQSKFARSLDLATPRQEISRGFSLATKMWGDIHKKAPRAKLFQLLGNHDDRGHKRLLEKCPELEYFADFKSVFEFNNVETIHDARQELIIDNIVFQHGHYAVLGQHMRYNLMKTVHGHSHKGGVVYMPHKNEIIWELDCGYLADSSAIPLSYSKQKQITKCTLGFGVIDEYGPRFIPL